MGNSGRWLLDGIEELVGLGEMIPEYVAGDSDCVI